MLILSPDSVRHFHGVNLSVAIYAHMKLRGRGVDTMHSRAWSSRGDIRGHVKLFSPVLAVNRTAYALDDRDGNPSTKVEVGAGLWRRPPWDGRVNSARDPTILICLVCGQQQGGNACFVKD
jgi:hypothetical protein